MCKIRVQRVSVRADGKTFCRPSDGYDANGLDIDPDQYEQIGTFSCGLPACDKHWPQ